MKTFFHSGKLGDIIFSLPTIQAMGGGILYLPEKGPESRGIYSNMVTLLRTLPYIQEVRQCSDVLKYGSYSYPVDVDLDIHRTHPQRGKVNMVQRYFDVFGITDSVPEQWIWLDQSPGRYHLINVTDRFREGSRVSWKHKLQAIPTPRYFMGTDVEYGSFVRKYGQIDRANTWDALGCAAWINNSQAIWCNQSFFLALACALNKRRYVEFKPGKTNCRFYTENEIAL